MNGNPPKPIRRLADRTRAWYQVALYCGILALASLAVVTYLAPQQLGVIVYDLAKISLGALLGLLVDVAAFPKAKPEIGTLLRHYLNDVHREEDTVLLDTTLAMHSLRRGLLIGLAMLALCLAP